MSGRWRNSVKCLQTIYSTGRQDNKSEGCAYVERDGTCHNKCLGMGT